MEILAEIPRPKPFERLNGRLRDEAVADREFGGWSMVHRRADEAPDAHDERMRRLLANVSEPVRAHFLALIATGER